MNDVLTNNDIDVLIKALDYFCEGCDQTLHEDIETSDRVEVTRDQRQAQNLKQRLTQMI